MVLLMAAKATKRPMFYSRNPLEKHPGRTNAREHAAVRITSDPELQSTEPYSIQQARQDQVQRTPPRLIFEKIGRHSASVTEEGEALRKKLTDSGTEPEIPAASGDVVPECSTTMQILGVRQAIANGACVCA